MSRIHLLRESASPIYIYTYWLLPAELMNQVADSCISRTHFSDHKNVIFRIQGPRFRARGPGIWRLNTTILQHEQYLAIIRGKVEETLVETAEWEPRKRWDFIKLVVREA